MSDSCFPAMLSRRGSDATSISLHADGSNRSGRAYYRDAMATEQWLEGDGMTADPELPRMARARSEKEAAGAGRSPQPVALDSAHAKVVIEEADDRALWDWGTYFSSLPHKLKGARQRPVRSVPGGSWQACGLQRSTTRSARLASKCPAALPAPVVQEG